MDTYNISELPSLDALAGEYQRDYGTASGNLDISYFVNNPFINSPLSIHSLGLQEKASDLFSGQGTVLGDNRPNAPLVAQ